MLLGVMKMNNNIEEGDSKYLLCQKFSKKIFPDKEEIKCLAPDKPCKYRLDCPIYYIWKNG